MKTAGLLTENTPLFIAICLGLTRHCAQTSLKHVEQFQACEELVLDNNALGDDVVFPAIPGLLTLTLNKNRIADTEKLLLEIKQCYPKLRFLSLLGNEACPRKMTLPKKGRSTGSYG